MPSESWVGSETSIGTQQLGSTWDLVGLGSVYLPGVCTIEGFKIGQDVDVQKKRKKEKARLRDNGIAPCSFKIVVEITAAQWGAWQKVLPKIQPRRAGALRTPLAILHPLPNGNGVNDVYVTEIEYDSPSARAGMKIVVYVHEWFEEEKETNTSNEVKTKAPLDPNTDNSPTEIDVTGNWGKFAVRNTQNMMDNSFKLNP